MKKHSFTLLFVLIVSSALIQANEQPQPPQPEAQQGNMPSSDPQIEAMQQASAARAARSQADLDAVRRRLAEMGLNPGPSLTQQDQEGEEKESPVDAAINRVRQTLQEIAAYRAQQNAQAVVGQQANVRAAAQLQPQIPAPDQDHN